MSKAPRVQNVQLPGAEQPVDEPQEAGTASELVAEMPAPAVAPDIAALVAAEVARALSKKASAAATKAKPVPTQEEAIAMVKADPKHRSVLSVDGWVVGEAPVSTPFAKA